MPQAEVHGPEEQLDAQQARVLLAAVWSAPGLAVAVFDAEGRFVAVNDDLVRLNGRSAADHRGRGVVDVLGPEVGGLILDHISRVVRSRATLTGVEVGGSHRVWETAWLPLPRKGDAAPPWVACLGIEVTDASVPALTPGVTGSRSAIWTARLLAVAQALSGAGGPNRALDEAFGEVARALGALRVLVGLIHGGFLTFRPDLLFVGDASAAPGPGDGGAAPDPGAAGVWPDRVALDDPAAFSGTVATTGRPLWFADALSLARHYPASVPGLTQIGEHAWAAVPIRVDGRVIGVLRLSWDSPQAFTQAQMAYVQAAADHAGQVLQRLALLEAERAARRAAESSRARSAHLLVLAQRLTAAASPREVAEIVLDAGLTGLDAVGAEVGLLDEQAGVLRILASTGCPNPGAVPLDTAVPFVHAATTGCVTISTREDVRDQPMALRWMEQTGSCACLAIPLRDEHKPVGSLSVHFAQREIGEEDAEQVRAVAALAGQALGRAFAQERAEAALAELQRALLPKTLPTGSRRLAVSAGYRPAPRATEIGGDFYDTVPLAGGGALLLLGDVQGHDLVASALMAQLRAVMHALALSGEPPAELLAQADAFLARVEPERMATALAIEIGPDSGLAVCASAGHLPPLLLDLDGADGCHVLDVPPGLPLGLGDRDRVERIVALPKHARFVLATDGLVERRAEVITDSLARLAAATLARRRETADALVVALLDAAPNDTGDDAAVLVADVHSTHPALAIVRRTLPARVGSAHLARRWAMAVLAGRGVPAVALQDAGAVVTELAANGARAATRTFTVVLQPRAGAVLVGVSDDSHRMPHRHAATADDVDGRGLTIVEALSRSWWVEEHSDGGGKTVWAEVPA